MDLILWRHAEADNGMPDHARELTAKGRKQAVKIAGFLHRHLADDALILVSPAVRTRQTVAAYSTQFSVTPSIAPGASARSVLQAVRWPDAGGTVLVVGHQPTLGAVAAQLLGCADSTLNIKKCALWWFSLREHTAQVTLRLVLDPELL